MIEASAAEYIRGMALEVLRLEGLHNHSLYTRPVFNTFTFALSVKCLFCQNCWPAFIIADLFNVFMCLFFVDGFMPVHATTR